PKSPGNVNGQPSVLYAAEIRIDPSGRVPSRPFILQAIGHGDPEGLSGEIVPELDSLTTALEQLEKITITLRD
ncbi:MAG: hypothetical protein JW760_01005, partial [Spirochaetales bacterium]|nr:hypothetical protein [Spirochaetales bacterium]